MGLVVVTVAVVAGMASLGLALVVA